MAGFEDSDAFDSLLAAIEEAADEHRIGGDAFQPVGTLDGDGFKRRPTALTEQPKSLVDLRVLTYDLPLSHEPLTRSVEDIDLPEPGDLVDEKYEVLREAARTTLGYEVKHVVLRKKFVLQFLSPSVVDDPMLWPKFQSDIRAAGMLGHEHIEYVTDLGRCTRFGAYIVKELIDGPTFADQLKPGKKASMEAAVSFAHRIGGALSALHEIGIIHGRMTPRSVRRADDEGGPWKVLDVCIPGRDEELLAPEQQRGEGTGPEADQYALAHLTASLLLGREPVDGDLTGIDGPIAEVLTTALADHPLQRHADIDAFVGALNDAAPTTPAPSVDPFDRREATRNVKVEIPKEASGESSGFGERPRSVLIRVAPSAKVPRIVVEFASGARFRREYRRNILAGGLFVPTAEELTVGATANVVLRLPFQNAEVQVEGLVATRDPGSEDRPCGYGIAFDARARATIEKVAADDSARVEVPPTAKISAKRQFDKNAAIGAGEAFLLSRLRGAMTVGEARALFSGLPFDFDECLQKLMTDDWLEIEGMPAAPAKSAAASDPGFARASTRAIRNVSSANDYGNVARVLESVDYFEEQGNFMAAGRTLEAAAGNAPHVAVYFHRLALVRAKFDMDLRAARDAVRKARKLEPNNEEFQSTERYVATLVEISAVRVMWEKDITGRGLARWVRTAPERGRVFFTVGPGLVEVDWRAGTTRDSRVERGKDYSGAPVGDQRFVLDEDRPAVRWVDSDRGVDRVVLHLEGCTEPLLVRCADTPSAMLVARRRPGQWVGVWIDEKGDALGEYVFGHGFGEGVLRGDGKFAGRRADGTLLVADLFGGTMKTVDNVTPTSGSIAGTPWQRGTPLVLAEILDGKARVLSVDVDLLCG